MSRPAAGPPLQPRLTRYRLIRYDSGDWSLRRNGVECCQWNAAWPPAAILRIATLAVQAETRRPIVWRRIAFTGRPIVYLSVTAPARRLRPRRPRPGPGAAKPA